MIPSENGFTPTYKKICALAGRPTILDVARRATRVIIDQCPGELTIESAGGLRDRKSKFLLEIEKFNDLYDAAYQNCEKPRENPFYAMISGCKTLRERSFCVRMATDGLFRSHLYSRGYDTPLVCRLGCDASETFSHVLTHLDNNAGAQGCKRKLNAICRSESAQLDSKNKRVKLDLDAHTIAFTAKFLDIRKFGYLPNSFRAPRDPSRSRPNKKKKSK